MHNQHGNEPAGLAATEIDLELLAFMQRYAGSRTKWDVVMLFGANPFIQDTPAGIASRVGRNAGVVQREADDLVLLGLLERRPAGGAVSYSLTPNPYLRAVLSRFTTAFG